MDTRDVTAEYRLAQWSQIMQTRAQSGQSIKEFCVSTGISRYAYFYWQRKLREVACTEISERNPKVKPAADSLVPSGWAQLDTVEAEHEDASVVIEVSGCRIIATVETDLKMLAKVCRTLRTL